MVNYSETKSKLQLLYSLLDSVEENGGKPSDINISLRNVFKRDLQTFLMYLSAADGKISAEKRTFMNYLFDSNMSAQDYVRLINENNICSTNYEEKTPVIFQILISFDKKFQNLAGLFGKPINPCTPMFLDFYAETGKEIVACGGADQNDVLKLQNYIDGVVKRITADVESALPQRKNEESALSQKENDDEAFYLEF